jgi:hypothetical protein
MIDLSDFYPSSADLIKSEVSVLDHLRSNPYIQERQPQVARDANNYYARNRGSRSGFQFNSHFDVWHAPVHRKAAIGGKGKHKPNVRLTVSARIELNRMVFRNVTYCLAVCRIRSTGVMILRKFHFDVVGSNDIAGQRSQQHPRSHLQYCGEMVPYMAEIGCRASQLDQMHPWLSEPRIFFWPMSLALLIDMALHEFPDQGSAKFRADSYWRGLVRRQEALVLQPFYKKCIEIIVDNKGENRTLADAFYVVSSS